MKKLYNSINRFCYRHPNFGISNLMLFIVIGEALVFIINMMDTTGTFLSYLYFNFDLVLKGQVWRCITFIFIPQNIGQPIYEALALYLYYWIGSTLERSWGSAKFTVFYLSAMLGTMLYGALFSLLGYSSYGFLLSASYINLSMFFIFAMMYPDVRLLLFFFIPIKIKWLAIVNAVLFAAGIITSPFPVNLAPIVAVANVFIFCWPEVSGFFGKNSRQQRSNVIRYRNATRTARVEMNSRPFRHKCSICGKTDTDYPTMQFRYCSRCAGYHCFCEEHINAHTHFTE